MSTNFPINDANVQQLSFNALRPPQSPALGDDYVPDPKFYILDRLTEEKHTIVEEGYMLCMTKNMYILFFCFVLFCWYIS